MSLSAYRPHYQMTKKDRTERVRAASLRPADWIVVPFEGWAWQVHNVEVEDDRVWLSSPMVDGGTRRVWVGLDTMFVRRIVDRRTNMRPDLEPAGA